jgi:hypothetical protein
MMKTVRIVIVFLLVCFVGVTEGMQNVPTYELTSAERTTDDFKESGECRILPSRVKVSKAALVLNVKIFIPPVVKTLPFRILERTQPFFQFLYLRCRVFRN